ncbi:hypothetical protein NL676_023516, partial [Syzygium grande]
MDSRRGLIEKGKGLEGEIEKNPKACALPTASGEEDGPATATPSSPSPSQPRRRRAGGGAPPPPLQQHQNPYRPHAGAWASPTLLVRPQDHHHHHPHQHQQHSGPSNVERLERIDRAVAQARRDLLAAGESVSSWKVSQAAVLALQVDSWSSLGFSMQQVPSLKSLMAVEGKINTFIHCFVETRKITSFDVTEVFEITSEEIVCYLGEFFIKRKSGKRKSRKPIEIGDLLSFIAKEKSVSGTEKLGVRIQNLGLHISFILEARRAEETSLRTSLKKLKQQANEQRPDDVCLPWEEDLIGKDLNLNYSSSDDEDGDNSLNEDKKRDDDCNRDEKSGQNMLMNASESSQIIETKNLTYVDWLKRDMEGRDIILTNRANFTKKGKKRKVAKLVLETSAMRSFMKTWKEVCRACSIFEVVDKMLNMYRSEKKRGVIRNFIPEYPLVGLLNVAVTCIKCGMLEDEYDAIGKQMLNGLILSTPLPVSKDTQESVESATDKAQHSAEHTKSVTVEDIAREIGAYYQLDHEKRSNNTSVLEIRVNLLRKLVDCDSWLAKQFFVHEFESLGYGEFFSFLTEHISLMPTGLKQFLNGDIYEKSHFEAMLALDDDYAVELETIGKGTDVSQKIGKLESVSSQDAIEVLLKAPMLSFQNSTGTFNGSLVASRYFLQCLGYIPSEFRSFAADVLLSGMQSVIKHVPSTILSECKLMEERVMLHEVGLCLGVVEWVDDYHVFCSSTDDEMCKPCEAPSFKADTSKSSTGSLSAIYNPQKSSPAEVSLVSKGQSNICNEIFHSSDSPEVCIDKSLAQNEPVEYGDAYSIVESIRREEFGLDPSLSSTESNLLKKQHARLGRALHCLSQELYSQDSHFLLELVQNADDNTPKL